MNKLGHTGLLERIFRHRHRWTPRTLIGNKGRTIFYTRHCTCGAEQIQLAGPMGDGKWVDRKTHKCAHKFEQEWLDEAVPK